MNKLVSASILSADLLNLESEISRLEKNGIDMIHFDVMDGIFVPNISYGIPVLESINRLSPELLLDVHLMITDPLKYIDKFFVAGADYITFHLESVSDTADTIEAIRRTDASIGIAIKPDTPAEAVYPYINDVDMILVMTVEPGFGGQAFMDMSEKIRKIREYAESNRHNPAHLWIEVDGGIDDKTAPIVKNAGADVLVSGSYLFRADDMEKAVSILRT